MPISAIKIYKISIYKGAYFSISNKNGEEMEKDHLQKKEKI